MFGYSLSTLLLYRCYYPHRSRDLMSRVCRLFLYCITPNPTKLYCTILLYTALPHTLIKFAALICFAQPSMALHCNLLHCTSMPYSALHPPTHLAVSDSPTDQQQHKSLQGPTLQWGKWRWAGPGTESIQLTFLRSSLLLPSKLAGVL